MFSNMILQTGGVGSSQEVEFYQVTFWDFVCSPSSCTFAYLSSIQRPVWPEGSLEMQCKPGCLTPRGMRNSLGISHTCLGSLEAEQKSRQALVKRNQWEPALVVTKRKESHTPTLKHQNKCKRKVKCPKCPIFAATQGLRQRAESVGHAWMSPSNIPCREGKNPLPSF